MAETALVKYNGLSAGMLEELSDGYRFTYADDYLNNSQAPSISLTISKTKKVHESSILFPFFYGLLAEGANKEVQCRQLKIDEDDHFTRLIKTAATDTIGAVTVHELT